MSVNLIADYCWEQLKMDVPTPYSAQWVYGKCNAAHAMWNIYVQQISYQSTLTLARAICFDAVYKCSYCTLRRTCDICWNGSSSSEKSYALGSNKIFWRMCYTTENNHLRKQLNPMHTFERTTHLLCTMRHVDSNQIMFLISCFMLWLIKQHLQKHDVHHCKTFTYCFFKWKWMLHLW